MDSEGRGQASYGKEPAEKTGVRQQCIYNRNKLSRFWKFLSENPEIGAPSANAACDAIRCWKMEVGLDLRGRQEPYYLTGHGDGGILAEMFPRRRA